MIITCKNCSINYLVPDNSFSSNGRNVKCANCKAIWFQFPISLEEISTPDIKLDKLPKDLKFNEQHVPVIIEKKSKTPSFFLASILLTNIILAYIYLALSNSGQEILDIKEVNIDINSSSNEINLNYKIENSSNSDQKFDIQLLTNDANSKIVHIYDVEKSKILKTNESTVLSNKITEIGNNINSITIIVKKHFF